MHIALTSSTQLTGNPTIQQSLTYFDLLPLCALLMVRPFAWLAGCWGGARDFTLWHPEVQQQGADLGLELQAARVFKYGHQVQLQVLSHAADLRLGQSWR